MRKLTIILLLLCAAALNAKDASVLRPRSYLREGPAAYYQILSELPLKTKVKVLKPGSVWVKVQHNQQTGYVSASSFQAPSQKTDPFSNMARPSLSANTQGVTAGVKGFCARFSQQLSVNSSFPELALSTGVKVNEYNDFRRNSLQGRKIAQFQKAYKMPSRKLVDYYSEAAEGFGLAVAGIVAAQGLYKNAPLANYVNLLGTYLASAADTPEIQYRFFLLDISQPNAYACPGGYIFISKGMVQLVSSEAELAFVLAHEIAHVSRFHGMMDVKLMENQIAAKDVFDELDADFTDSKSLKLKDVEAEMESDIVALSDMLVQGRLDKYEEEADELAMLIMARSAYNPAAGVELLYRLKNTRYESNNQHYRRASVEQRLQQSKAKLSRFQKPKLNYIDNHNRFNSMKRLLDTP